METERTNITSEGTLEDFALNFGRTFKLFASTLPLCVVCAQQPEKVRDFIERALDRINEAPQTDRGYIGGVIGVYTFSIGALIAAGYLGYGIYKLMSL